MSLERFVNENPVMSEDLGLDEALPANCTAMIRVKFDNADASTCLVKSAVRGC